MNDEEDERRRTKDQTLTPDTRHLTPDTGHPTTPSPCHLVTLSWRGTIHDNQGRTGRRADRAGRPARGPVLVAARALPPAPSAEAAGRDAQPQGRLPYPPHRHGRRSLYRAIVEPGPRDRRELDR